MVARHIKSTSDGSKKLFVNLFRPYVELIPYSDNTDRYEKIGSMYVIFMSSILLPKTGVINPQHNLDFVLMYGMVDHLLDTKTVSEDQKSDRIQQIKRILYTGQAPTDTSRHIQVLFEIYQRHIHISGHIQKAFEAEYVSYKLQETECSEEQYFQICKDKGATMFFLQKAINSIQIDYQWDPIVGFIGQLLDDMLDVEDDIRNNIRTPVTYVLNTDRILDRVFYKIVDMIKSLPTDRYGTYRAFLVVLVYHIASVNPYITPELKKKCRGGSLTGSDAKINVLLGKSVCEMIDL